MQENIKSMGGQVEVWPFIIRQCIKILLYDYIIVLNMGIICILNQSFFGLFKSCIIVVAYLPPTRSNNYTYQGNEDNGVENYDINY